MVNFLIVFIAIFIYIRYLKNIKGGYLYPSVFLLFLYGLSITCGIIDVYMSNEKHILEGKYLPYSFVFVFYLSLFIIPFASFTENKNERIILPNKEILDVFSSIIIILSFFSIAFFSSGVVKVFSLASLSDARNDRYIYGDSYIETGITYTICSVSASMFVFALLLFFIYLCIGGHKKRCTLLFISSFSEVMHVLTEVGRDGVVFWLFNFIFLSLLFKDYMGEDKKRMIKRIFYIFGSVALVPFVLISLSRFEGNVIGDLVSYMGQQFKHFCYYFDFDPLPVSYGRSFPLYYEITNQTMPENVLYGNSLTRSTTFGTFIRGFFTNFGLLGTFFVGVIMWTLFKMCMGRPNNKLKFNKLFIYLLYFQIYGQGVFYFRQYTRGGNLFIVLSFVFYFVFNAIISQGNNVVIHKRQTIR